MAAPSTFSGAELAALVVVLTLVGTIAWLVGRTEGRLETQRECEAELARIPYTPRPVRRGER